MWRKRIPAVLALLFLLAGPLGLLAVGHAALHGHCHTSSDAEDQPEIPCPVCQFLTTVSLETPPPAPALPGLAVFGPAVAAPVAAPAFAPAFAPTRSRAPPIPA